MPQFFEVGLGASPEFGTTSFSFYSTGHIIQIAATAVILGLLFLLCFKKKHWINRVLWVCMIFGFLNMGALLAYSLITGVYNLEWYVPLHICNLFLIVIPLALFCKGRVRTFLMDYIVGCGLGGCWVAIILPTTSQLYFPPFHFVSIMVWTYHIMIGFLGGFMIVSGNYKRFKCYSVISLMSLLLIASYIVNPLLKTNFLFVNPERAFFPMNIFYMVFGDIGALAIVMMIFSVAIMLHMGFWFYENIKQRSTVQLLKDWGVTEFFLKHRFDKKVIESEFYSYVSQTALAKDIKAELKKDTNVFNKLYKAIMESGLVESLLNNSIEELTDLNKLEKTVAKSHIIKRICSAVALSDLIKAKPQKVKVKRRGRRAAKEISLQVTT